jgi:hypothetical protein
MSTSVMAEFYVSLSQAEYDLVKDKIAGQFHEVERVGEKMLLTMVERGSVEAIKQWLDQMDTAAKCLEEDIETAQKTLGEKLFNQTFRQK